MNSKIAAFRRAVLNHYKAQGRHALPWRKDHDPYHVLVSEVMLQQTQVDRVIPYFEAWLKEFPNVRALATAPLSKVLRAWQGLGYNRRAKMLHQAVKAIVKEYNGVFPKTPEALEELPGIGPYTARAVAAFAYNQDVVFIETNIRTVVTHHFFPFSSVKSDLIYQINPAESRAKKGVKTEREKEKKGVVDDKEILRILVDALPKGKSREWYSALMDYGAHLKRTGVRLNARAKGYKKQKTFEGSDRQARGAILKALVRGPKESRLLIDLFGPERRGQLRNAIASLTKEGMIELKQGKFRLHR